MARCRCAGGGGVPALGGPTHGAILQGYSVQKVGGPADNFYNISGQTAINDAGDIAFRAEGLLGLNPHSSQAGIFVRTGGAFTTIALRMEAGGQFSSIDFPAGISSAGFVAFRGTLPSPVREGIFAGDGGAPITIATAACGVACEFDNIDLDPAISTAGVVAFVAQHQGVHSLYTQSLFGGPRTLIAFGNGTNPGSPLRGFIEGMSINAAGDVAFRAGLDTHINDVGIFVGNGSTITPIAQTGDLAPNGETFASNFSRPAINAVGDVAFCATLANARPASSSTITGCCRCSPTASGRSTASRSGTLVSGARTGASLL